MGAAALTTTGFAISRERMRDLLAFDDIIENSWDAVAGADYITESASAVQLVRVKFGAYCSRFSNMGDAGVQCFHIGRSIRSDKFNHAAKT